MKKILIIEDDQFVAKVYRNKLNVDGYQTEAALDGETGLRLMRTFRPDAIVLDLILPKMQGIEVIKEIRNDAEFSKLPIVVLSNTYLTNLVRDAIQAGATKCLSKIDCTPTTLVELMHRIIGDSGAIRQTRPKTEGAPTDKQVARPREDEATSQASVRKSFIASLPAVLAKLRADLLILTKSDSEAAQLKQVDEIYRHVHAINGAAALAGLVLIPQLATAFEALLKELHDNPKTITDSTLHTVAAAVDFFNFLFERGTDPNKQEIPPASILVVDDDDISRRAIMFALEKANLTSFSVEDADAALKLLCEKLFDLVLLDIVMPGMTGHELCTKLRGLPMHKKTPVIFVTHLLDLDSRARATFVGGNDFITKPFLPVELAVKALIHVQRAKLQLLK